MLKLNALGCGWIILVLFFTTSQAELAAQETPVQDLPRVQIENIHWGYYRPGDVIAARMHAHADQMRSFGYGASKYGDFLIKREQSISMNLDNRLKRLQYYFEAKRINRAYREETYYDVRERQMLSNSRMWQQIKSLPELANKNSGRAQNFLLNRLSSTVLAFQYASEQGMLSDEKWLEHLKLPAEMYDHIWLKQGESKFIATSGQALDVSQWPYRLRDPKLAEDRERLVQVRNEIATGDNPKIGYEELERLAEAHQRLADALNRQHLNAKKDPSQRSNSRQQLDERTEWRRAFQFLDGMYLEIRKLKQSGSRDLLSGKIRFEPAADANFISFLNYMQRNGLEFAPATKAPDSIAAYNTCFYLMRDLYLLAADEDAAVTDPKKNNSSR